MELIYTRKQTTWHPCREVLQVLMGETFKVMYTTDVHHKTHMLYRPQGRHSRYIYIYIHMTMYIFICRSHVLFIVRTMIMLTSKWLKTRLSVLRSTGGGGTPITVKLPWASKAKEYSVEVRRSIVSRGYTYVQGLVHASCSPLPRSVVQNGMEMIRLLLHCLIPSVSQWHGLDK